MCIEGNMGIRHWGPSQPNNTNNKNLSINSLENGEVEL